MLNKMDRYESLKYLEIYQYICFQLIPIHSIRIEIEHLHILGTSIQHYQDNKGDRQP